MASPEPYPARGYALRVVVAAAVGGVTLAALLLLWQISHVVLVFFAAILVAVLLDGTGRLLQRAGHLPRQAALGLVIAVIASAIAGFGWVVGPQVSAQVSALGTRIPEAAGNIGALLQQEAWGRALLRTLPEPAEILPPAAGILGPISGAFSTTVGAITNAVIIVIGGVYMAVEPGRYVNGVLALLPIHRREYGQEILRHLGRALRWWLIGRLVSMLAVGLLTGAGLWLIEVPLVLALAFIAALLSFVPYLGPIISAVPAVLIGFTVSPPVAAYVVIVYAAVQFLEGNLITPIVQERAVSLPPAILLIAQLAMWVLFGILGVFLATPMAVLLIALVQILYVRDTLGDSIQILGQHRRFAEDD